MRIAANTRACSLGEVIAEIRARAASLQFPPGYRLEFTGESEDMAESFGYLGQPLAIMLSLLLSLVGVAGMLYLIKDTLDIMSLISLIGSGVTITVPTPPK